MRSDYLKRIELERERHSSLPGSEYDLTKTPNDWIAIINKYLGSAAKTNAITPSREDFEDDFIKAAAVCLAALEYSEKMTENKHLADSKK